MRIQCCACGLERRGLDWRAPASQAADPVSHGYCPACAAAARLEVEIMHLQGSYLRAIGSMHFDPLLGAPTACRASDRPERASTATPAA